MPTVHSNQHTRTRIDSLQAEFNTVPAQFEPWNLQHRRFCRRPQPHTFKAKITLSLLVYSGWHPSNVKCSNWHNVRTTMTARHLISTLQTSSWTCPPLLVTPMWNGATNHLPSCASKSCKKTFTPKFLAGRCGWPTDWLVASDNWFLPESKQSWWATLHWVCGWSPKTNQQLHSQDTESPSRSYSIHFNIFQYYRSRSAKFKGL